VSRYRKPALAAFEPYVPGIQPRDGEAWVKLNTNESPYPPAPGLAAAIAEQVDRLRLYPDPEQVDLREAISQVLDVGPDHVIAGNGADEVLAMCVRAFVPRGGRAAFLEPGYTLVPKLLAINEVDAEEHAYGDLTRLPRSFIQSDAPLKFLVNPNSPTGTMVSLEVVADTCAASPGVVVLDEAYVDFATTSGRDLLDGHPNLLLVRSLSKSYGLAGLRVGFAVGSPDLIADLRTVKDMCNIGRLQSAAAIAALADRAYWERGVAEVVANRERLTKELTARGWTVLPSAANFVFAIPPGDAGEVYRTLLDRHVLVRWWGERPAVSDGLRVSIGRWEDCLAMLRAIDG